jgi:hypothetical protein
LVTAHKHKIDIVCVAPRMKGGAMSLQGTGATLWDFARFEAGQSLGSVTVTMDRARLRLWSEIFEQPAPGETLSASLLVPAMMEAYLSLAQPRPPGNIHAGQKLVFFGRAPRPDEVLDIAVTVTEKFERKGRKWLRFTCSIHVGGALLATGEILTIWAR